MYIWNQAEMTKARLFEIIEVAGISSKAFLRRKEKEAPGEFDPKNWSKYLSIAVDMSVLKIPCRICSSPLIFICDNLIFLSQNPNGYVCSAHRIHAFPPSSSDDDLLRHLGQKCEHGYYMAEHHECIEKLCELNRMKKENTDAS